MYKGVNPERKLLMDLKVYAISQKLKNENSELIKYVNNDNIPRDIIEKEFKEVFESYQDDKAELLADDYRQYLLGTTQVMFSKNSSGLNIEGELKDNVVDIIETIHKISKEEMVHEVVSDLVETINPTRDYEIKNISFIEQLSALENRIVAHKSKFDELKITQQSEDRIEEVSKVVEKDTEIKNDVESSNIRKETTVQEKPKETAVENIVNKTSNKDMVKTNVENEIVDTSKIIEEPVTKEDVEEKVTTIEEDINEKKIIEEKTKEIIKNYINNLIKSAKEKNIDERIPLTNSYSYVL